MCVFFFLKSEIQNKIKSVRSVIDMLSKIIKDEHDSKFEKTDEKPRKGSFDGVSFITILLIFYPVGLLFIIYL